jgi:hypothetical protein
MSIRGRPFPKGVSGNPGGRPKELRDIVELAKAHSADAIDTLASLMRDRKVPPAARVAAANAILDRGFGKPRQGVELSGHDGGPIEHKEVSDEARLEAFMEFMKKTKERLPPQ